MRLSEFREIQFNFVVNYFYYTQADGNYQNRDVHDEKVRNYVISVTLSQKIRTQKSHLFTEQFTNVTFKTRDLQQRRGCVKMISDPKRSKFKFEECYYTGCR